MSDVSSSELLLSLICDCLGVHGVVLFTPAGDVCELEAASCTGKPTPIRCSIAPGKGLVGWILRNHQPLILNSFDATHSLLGYYDMAVERNITAFMGVPLAGGGALCMDSTDDRRSFTPRDQQLLQQFAAVAEAQIRLLRDYGTQTSVSECFEAAAKLQALAAKTPGWRRYLKEFLAILREASGLDYAALAMIPEGALNYSIEDETEPLLLANGASPSLPLGSGLAGWTFSEGLPVFAEGIDGTATSPLFGKLPEVPPFQSVICLPVVHSHTVCGVLVLAGEKGRPFPQALRTLVQMAAALLGDHLEALYLRHRIQSMLPRAQMYFDTAPHDPDTAPVPSVKEDA